MELSKNTTPLYSLGTIGQALLIELLVLGFAFITFTGIFNDKIQPQDVSINLVMSEEPKALKPPEPPKPKPKPGPGDESRAISLIRQGPWPQYEAHLVTLVHMTLL